MLQRHFYLLLFLLPASLLSANDQPNILWLTSEDHGPHMGCYGDAYATTPHVDALAKRGLRFARCWSNAPVCAPARTTIISGLYPPSTGSEHMRSMTNLPADFKMYPQFLRGEGYYCTNNSKEDYNLKKPEGVWDQSNAKAHWKNRQEGQPFFAVFNATASHESQFRGKKNPPVHNPAGVRVPAYHPDDSQVRSEWAHYYDNITKVDAEAGKHLQELAAAGLADDTIVFYYADHGSGLPRNKRSPCNSGLQVPFVVYFPPKYQHLAPRSYAADGVSEQLISFVDLAPTLLSIVGVKPPDWMQGVAFSGKFPGPARKYLFGFRGRMDERYDLIRSVTDGRYVYVRNFMPHLPQGQHVEYMFQTTTTRVWKKLYDDGKATPAQSYFWQTKQPEELYDLTDDPDEVRNLATSTVGKHAAKLTELRQALREEQLRIRDVGMLPEDEMHARAVGTSPYEMGHNLQKFPLEQILAMAEKASSLAVNANAEVVTGLEDADAGVRYWAALGFLMRDAEFTKTNAAKLQTLLKDKAPSVVIAAASALAKHTDGTSQQSAVAALLAQANTNSGNIYINIEALNALDNLPALNPQIAPAVKTFSRQSKNGEQRVNDRVAKLIRHILGEQDE